MKFYGSDIATLSRRRIRPAFIDDALFATFLEALPDGAALMELDGRIKLVNSKFEMLLSLGKGDLVGTELVSHAATGGQIIQKAAAALQQLKRLEVAGTLPSQRLIVASLSILRTGDGGAYAALLVLREPNRLPRPAGGGPDRFRFQDEGAAAPASLYVPAPHLQGLMKSGALALERGSPILVVGESGTGKSAFVRRLCKAGEQGATPFVHVNCGMLGDAQFEAEMFGPSQIAVVAHLPALAQRFEIIAGAARQRASVGDVPWPRPGRKRALCHRQDGVVRGFRYPRESAGHECAGGGDGRTGGRPARPLPDRAGY